VWWRARVLRLCPEGEDLGQRRAGAVADLREYRDHGGSPRRSPAPMSVSAWPSCGDPCTALNVTFCRAAGQTGMSWKGSGIVRRSLTAICLLIPLAASANPVMLNPSSLIAFYIVAFWAFVVEAGVVTLLLTFRGVAPLRVFVGYFIANVAVFFFLFQPLLEGGSSPPVLALEALVVLIDGLIIKLLVTLGGFQGDNFRGVSWVRSTLVSGIGNALSYFVGYIAMQRPWEVHPPPLGE
jgi:hypothetical protein